MGNIENRLEYMTDQDPFFDFCLWEYKPLASFENKFRSANLLFHSFDFAGTNERIYEIIQAIREGIGLSNTVWGVKQIGEILSWEFYFYDYRRTDRERSVSKLLNILKPFTSFEIKANHNYFMFSIDLDNDFISGSGDLDEIHMYIGNPGSTVSSGICYSLTDNGTKLENFYFFFDAEKDMEDIIGKATCSAHLESAGIDLDQILWPEMKNSRVIVVANKQENDAVYFSGINIDQLIFFLKKMNYPDKIVSFAVANRSKLDHLQYDAGFDYRMEERNLKILKSGYYGIF